jgi:acetyl-CoA carboxylase biotin carboxyl carrier protein
MKINIHDIEKLIDLFEKSSLTEIEISDEKEKLRLSREYHYAASHPAPLPPVMAPAPLHTPVAQQVTPVASAIDAVPAGHVLKAPMVGTAYLSPSPDAPAFVKVGQSIKVGDSVCIIEAMKMMNRIEADKAGKITAILAENGKPVEFDQPLFVIGE